METLCKKYTEDGDKGRSISWYENGQKEDEGGYSWDIEDETVDADYDGEVTSWFEDGKLQSIHVFSQSILF